MLRRQKRIECALDAFMETTCGAITVITLIISAVAFCGLAVPNIIGWTATFLAYTSILFLVGCYTSCSHVRDKLAEFDRQFKQIDIASNKYSA